MSRLGIGVGHRPLLAGQHQKPGGGSAVSSFLATLQADSDFEDMIYTDPVSTGNKTAGVTTMVFVNATSNNVDPNSGNTFTVQEVGVGDVVKSVRYVSGTPALNADTTVSRSGPSTVYVLAYLDFQPGVVASLFGQLATGGVGLGFDGTNVFLHKYNDLSTKYLTVPHGSPGSGWYVFAYTSSYSSPNTTFQLWMTSAGGTLGDVCSGSGSVAGTLLHTNPWWTAMRDLTNPGNTAMSVASWHSTVQSNATIKANVESLIP